jgi:hypothetical protein
MWCCAYTGHGCQTTTNATTPSTPWIDCDIQDSDFWAAPPAGLSPEQRAWCCTTAGRGCQTPTTTLSTLWSFSCDDRYSALGDAWPAEEREWCCKYRGQGCAAPTTSMIATTGATSPPAFDCDASVLNPIERWSVTQRQWCCAYLGQGCQAATTSPPPPVDCSAQDALSDGQQAWCCTYEGVFCPSPTPSPTPAAAPWLLSERQRDAASVPYSQKFSQQASSGGQSVRVGAAGAGNWARSSILVLALWALAGLRVLPRAAGAVAACVRSRVGDLRVGQMLYLELNPDPGAALE